MRVNGFRAHSFDGLFIEIKRDEKKRRRIAVNELRLKTNEFSGVKGQGVGRDVLR